MILFGKMLAFGGLLTDSVMELRERDHSGPYDRGLLLFVCGLLLLATAGVSYLTLDAFTTTWTNTTIASVADGSALHQHVVVTGDLRASVKTSCDTNGGCYYLSVVGDRSGNVVFVVGTQLRMNSDGTVTAKGAVGSQLPADPDIQQAAALQERLYPSATPTSAVFIDGRKLNDDPVLILLFAIFIGSLAPLMWQSYRIGIVPFSPTRVTTAAAVPHTASGLSEVRCGVTGAIDCSAAGSVAAFAGLFTYRDRSARLTLEGREMTLRMTTWWPRHPLSPRTYVPGDWAVLSPSDVVAPVQPGKAYLVLKSKPAVKLTTRGGPLLLTFADRGTRDLVLGRLSDWLSPDL